MHLSEEGFNNELQDARTANSWAATSMLVAVAHVLRRPVALLASQADMAPGRVLATGVAVHLPARLPPEQCCPHPLLLAWGGPALNHYVPLCRSSELGPGPALPHECRPTVACPGGASVEMYIPVGHWHLNDISSLQLRNGLLTSRMETDTKKPKLALLMLEERLFMESATASKELLCSMPADEAAALLLDPRLMVAAEADPARLPLAALVQHAATRRLQERLTLLPHNTGLDERCIAATDKLAEELPPRLVAALALARLHEEELQLEQRLGLTIASGVQLSDAESRNLRNLLAIITLERAVHTNHMYVAAAVEAKEAAAAAAKARAEEADRVLLERLLQASPIAPRWAKRALTGCVCVWRTCVRLSPPAADSPSFLRVLRGRLAAMHSAPAALAQPLPRLAPLAATLSAPVGRDVRFNTARAQLAARVRGLAVPLPTLPENPSDQDAIDTLMRSVKSFRADAAEVAASVAKPEPPAQPLTDVAPTYDGAAHNSEEERARLARLLATTLALLVECAGEGDVGKDDADADT